MDALWPHFRTDAVGIICLVVAVVCLVTTHWPGVLIFALGVAVFCAISPHMEEGFKFSALGISLTGTFRKIRKKRGESLEGSEARSPADPNVRKRR
jgi:hypothetical protein